MRKSKFTEEQMVSIVRECDRDDVVVVAKRHKISAQTIYIWKKKFGAFDANEVRRLKQLEIENGRLKKILAERDLEIEVMKEIAAKNGERRRSPCRRIVCDGPGPVATAGFGASARGEEFPHIQEQEGDDGRARRRAHEGARGEVPALRLPAHQGLS